MVVLETRRLTLRRLVTGDLNALFGLYLDPEIRRYFLDGTLTLGEIRPELEWFRHGHHSHPQLGLWAAVERRSGVAQKAGLSFERDLTDEHGPCHVYACPSAPAR